MFNQSDCWSTKIHQQITSQTSKHLWRFIQRNGEKRAPEEQFLQLTKLSSNDLRLLSNIHFLLSDECQRLLYVIAPAIISRLKKTSIARSEITRGGHIRGPISWPQTIAQRMSTGGDPSLFVTMTRSSEFDLPENQLFFYLLKQTLSIASGWAANVSDAGLDEKYIEGEKWILYAERLRLQALKITKNPLSAKVGKLQEITETIIEKTERARGGYYTELAAIARDYLLLIKAPVGYLQQKVSSAALYPLDRNTLYELAVLFRIIELCLESGWLESKIHLVGGGHGSLSLLIKGDRQLTVYYQALPSMFHDKSSYKDLMDECGLSDKYRRPDIILEFAQGAKKRYSIVEVKRSASREYLSDGVYKLLGYLKDFEQVSDAHINLQGVLVGWDLLKPALNHEVSICSWESLRQTIKMVIEMD